MVRRNMEKFTNVMQWGKLLLPLSSIRFYPPPFVLRNPVLEGVTSAINDGCEVAVLVFNIKNMNELSEELSQSVFLHFKKQIKKFFRIAVELEIEKQNVITLHDFYGDSLTLYIKVDDARLCLSEIDSLMKKITSLVERSLHKHYPSIQPIFVTGYMFVEKKYYSLNDSIERAHRQAIAMAEKRVKSEFNEMVFSVKRIISKKDIILLAQPIIKIATKEICALEMLTRGPKGTLLESPLPLFSVARQTGMLYELEMIVIEKVLGQIKATRCRQDIFVNCTPLTLGNIRFTRDLKNLMQQYKGISAKQITFEVTETDSIEGLKNFIYNLKMLRLMGFRIAMDDTGAGYSSLSTIGEIMPDIIKIDRSVIQNIDKNSLKESMLKGIMLIAREAGSLVVAEGIENEEEASVLMRHNVDLAQGYFYARPSALVNSMAT
ncbi:Cyclic di-GMP phosphodiesterase PdeF [Neobacillus rhizosphaerae]|uniref:Cyclic di-GMP phosphodiesterase PdeF n=1 Tax=Neobacillus rhizosphaerae TaxID=2880965 RepID=A0ABN8KPZ4_9BACI|nr:EAL domain-containing protein [Neobacillus rhizosphaerae]CAH2714395.1 Cyclic di-GMP phosphodiesterase PdeF [Neobacillus rhizosphaerae]